MSNLAANWPVYDTLPPGWVIDRTAGSPMYGHAFITNGKSLLNGQKRALMPVCREAMPESPIPVQPSPAPQKPEPPTGKRLDPTVSDPAYPRTANDLARAQFKHRMLADIRFDLAVCEIEGWNKLEYIAELVALLRTIGQTKERES